METKDAQMYSTVHGGTMMNLMEEAGAILSAEYCQANTVRHSTLRQAFIQHLLLH